MAELRASTVAMPLGETEHSLEFIFHPRSIAVVGASTSRDGQGNNFVLGPKEHGFAGPIYPINPKVTELLGLRAYPSVLEVPDPLDYVVSSIPAAAVPELLRQCGRKGVKAVHMYTAGFRETGDRERTQLEQHILQVAREEGIRLLGPNCMGVYYPAGRMSFSPEFSRTPGPVGMVSQSGGNAMELVSSGTARGLRFSKVISFGNALDINEADLLDYLGQDADTRFICMYLEGLAQGPRFFRVLREVAVKKPVVILKGGRTQAGARAAASHTGALASMDILWDTLCRQTGAIRVFGIEEMVDILATLVCGVRPESTRVAIVGGGGGASVVAADDCAALGLQVPSFSVAVQERLRPLVHEAGTSIRNPVDAGTIFARRRDLLFAAETIGRSEEVDAFVVHMGFNFPARGGGRWRGRGRSPLQGAQLLAEAARAGGKPFFTVLRNEAGQRGNPRSVRRLMEGCLQEGIPVFPTMTRAANALMKVFTYYTKQDEEAHGA